MKITYDKEADAAYIYLRKIYRSSGTLQIASDIILDFGTRREILGIEILNVSHYIPLRALKMAGAQMLPA